jgi:predicted permease
LLVESGLLAAAGGALGIGLAALLQPAIVAFMPADIPRLDAVAIDAGVLALAVAATITSAIVVGLLPALQFGRLDLRPVMHGTRVRSDAGQGRIRHLLVAAQVALALVLLVSAALLVKSFYRLQAVDAGFDPARLLTVQLDLPGARYPDNAAHRRFYDDLLARLQATPGIAVAAGTTAAPGEGSGMTFSYAIDGRPSSTPTGREAPLPLQAVTAGYFDVMGIAVVAGRGIESGDREDAAPVVVINEALARQHWSDRSPLGRRLSFRPGQTPWLEIVGVVANTRDEGRAEEAPPTLYVPFAQKPPTWTWMTWQTLVVRAGIDRPETLRPAIEAAVWSLDPDLPLLEVRTMDAAMAEPEARRRFATQLFGAFALIAVLLGAVGVYGVMAYGVAQRRQEIGIRLMLGARPAQVVVAVSKAALLFAGAGLAAGVVAAAGATRLLESLLYDVAPTDVATFASMALALFAVAGLAAWIPARRALQLDPVVVLRDS